MNRREITDFLKNGRKSFSGVPAGFWMHFPAEAKSGNEAVDAHCDYYAKTDVPIVKIMNEHTYRLSRKIEKASDWKDIKSVPFEKSNYPAFIEELKALRERLGDDAFILVTIHGVLVSACHATDGMGRFPDLKNTITRHLKENPEAVENGLEVIASDLRVLSEKCLGAGADGIYYADLGSEEERFTEEMYRTYVAPCEKRLLSSLIDKGVVVLHVCKAHPRLGMFTDYPCHVVNWAEHESLFTLEDGKRMFPGKRILGGFDNIHGVLFEKDIDAIYRTVDDVISRIGNDTLVIGADCTLPASIPLERIRSLVEYCKTR